MICNDEFGNCLKSEHIKEKDSVCNFRDGNCFDCFYEECDNEMLLNSLDE